MSEYIYDWTPNKQHAKEEIVRCRDCRFLKDGDSGRWCIKSITLRDEPDGFCAWGERKEEC